MVLDVKKERKGEKRQKFKEPASEENNEDRWSENSDNDKSSVLQNVASVFLRNALAGFNRILKFDIEGISDSLVFEENVSLEDQTDNDKEFS